MGRLPIGGVGAALVAMMGISDLAGEPAKPGDHPGTDKGRFIDTHVHFHDCKAGDLDKVAEWMKSNNVQRVINHPLAQSRPRNEAERKQMLANYANCKGRIDRFCIVFPEEVNSVEEAVQLLAREKQDGAIGFGEHYGVNLNFDDPKNLRLYAACSKVGLPVMFHMDRNKNLDEKGLPRLENVLKQYPDCILIAHSDWWKSLGDGTCDRLLKTYPNLYADISCTVTRSVIGRDKEFARAFFIRNGKWLLKLKPLKAGTEPAEMLISDSDGKQVTLRNLLVGEVWMASGQSNMQWLAGKCDVANIVAALSAKGEHPPIREFGVTSVVSALHPIEHAAGEWKIDDYSNYSAIAFAFANTLYQELKVPIGILNCSFSQTSIESWTPREGFADGTDEYTRSIYQNIRETNPATPEHKAAWSTFYQDLEDAMKDNAELVKNGKEGMPVKVATPGNVSDNRDPSWMFNGKLNPVIPYAIRGCIWNRGTPTLGAASLITTTFTA